MQKMLFVIGSNVMGPMGDELIPFKDENSANEFSKDHFGKKIVKFNEITLDTIPKNITKQCVFALFK